MSKGEAVTFLQGANDAPCQQMPENYTSINGIYGSVITPQFLNASDNVNQSPAELLKAEQVYVEQQDLRFFRIR